MFVYFYVVVVVSGWPSMSHRVRCEVVVARAFSKRKQTDRERERENLSIYLLW